MWHACTGARLYACACAACLEVTGEASGRVLLWNVARVVTFGVAVVFVLSEGKGVVTTVTVLPGGLYLELACVLLHPYSLEN